MQYEYSADFAASQDQNDPLRKYRDQFHIPQVNGKDSIYYTGNSLGLQPKSTKGAINEVLEDWAHYGVEGHFHAKNSWFDYHKLLIAPSAKLVGGTEKEVVCMNSLTANLHFLLVSFYRPTEKRFKIICEKKAFPSDHYTLETQVQHHGYTYDEAVVEVGPRDGEHTIREEDILAKIAEVGDELALVFWGGVNYYTGQVFDLKGITAAAHNVGALAGFDLAHGVGNIKLELHNWNVDFAAWCGYKYLNSSPGGISGVYIHEKHACNPETPRFGGWWGHDEESRFMMEPGFKPTPTAEGWQLSNAPILSMVAHKASLEIFEEVGMDALCEKRDKLTGYLEFVLDTISAKYPNSAFEIITPRNQTQRGCQISMLTSHKGKAMFDYLTEKGVIADWREPNVIRLAPVPLYNSFTDVYQLGQLIEEAIQQ